MNTLGEEVDAVTDFIERKWNPIDNLKEIVQACAHQASHDFRAAFGDMEIFRLLEKRESEGRDRKTPDGNFLNHVFMTSKKIKDVALEIDGPWRFEDKARNVINRVRASHPDVINAKPKGWREFGKDYNDFDGMEEYCKNFGFDLLDHIAKRSACVIEVVNQESLSPQEEMTEDLLSIVHTFSCRLYGMRKYKRKSG